MVILGLCFDETATGAPFSHDRALVALSFAVAVIGPTPRLNLPSACAAHSGGAGSVWHAASAIVLGRQHLGDALHRHACVRDAA